jgi:hypothetical protein
MTGKKIVNHQDLEVYQRAFEAAMVIFQLSKSFPKKERYALTIRFDALPVLSAPTWQRRGDGDATNRHLSIDSPLLKAKPLKLKSG